MTQPRDNTLAPHIRKPLIYIVRAGYAARGTVYILTGVLAGARAAGMRGESEDTQGALQLVHRSPFGSVLLLVLTVGLAAYGLWNFAKAIFDLEPQADHPLPWMRRFAFFFTGVLYAALVLLALQTFMGWSRRGEGNRSARHWTARLMSLPLGRWAVAAVGIGFVCYMIAQIVASRQSPPHDQLALRAQQRRWVGWMIRFGILARALVFGLIGVFLIIAAIHLDPRKVEGLAGTLGALRAQPAGRWMLAVIAIGFVAYGAYDLVLAAYRVIRIDPPATKT
jgi:Domain of Unknown Function (DUF1206)